MPLHSLCVGSCAGGDAIPAHVQLKCEAKEVENRQINIKVMINAKQFRGQWGHVQETFIDTQFNCTLKAGMDTVEFEKYLNDVILQLYPDVKNKDRKRVMILVDSGLG